MLDALIFMYIRCHLYLISCTNISSSHYLIILSFLVIIFQAWIPLSARYGHLAGDKGSGEGEEGGRDWHPRKRQLKEQDGLLQKPLQDDKGKYQAFIHLMAIHNQFTCFWL